MTGRYMQNNKATHFYTHILLLSLISLMTGCAGTPQAKFEIPVFPSPPDEPRFYYQESIISSADVLREDKDSAFKRMITGQSRSGVGMSKPFAVSVHQGRVFVSDTSKRLVAAYDKQEGKYLEIGTSSPGELYKPMGLDTDNQGTLYVCDANMKQVVVYDRDGKYLRTLGNRELFSRPSGLTVNPEGSKVFVVDTGGVNSDWHRIVVLDAQTGEFLYNISQRGSDKEDLNLPREATITPNGDLYVVDGGNFRIQVYTQDGEHINTFGEIGRRSGQFARPKGIGSDKDGNIYVADAAFGNFQIFNPDGQILLAVGNRRSEFGAANFMLPAGLAVDEDGRVYMVDQYFQKVDVFRPAALAFDQGYYSSKPKPDPSKPK